MTAVYIVIRSWSSPGECGENIKYVTTDFNKCVKFTKALFIICEMTSNEEQSSHVYVEKWKDEIKDDIFYGHLYEESDFKIMQEQEEQET